MGRERAQALLQLWNEWEIQSVVLLSFTLQLFLFFFSGIRRYRVSFVVRAVLWLVYLFADVTATFGLGYMSSSTDLSRVHQLVPIWAPFLVLHLGGQDTITAYALEDNKLWMRHLLNLFVQVASTAYVLYKHIISDGSFVAAAVLVMTAGVLKYGERICALKRASTSGSDLYWIRLMMQAEFSKRNPAHVFIFEGCSITAGDKMYEHVTHGAHSLLFYPGIGPCGGKATQLVDGDNTFENLWEVLKYDVQALEQSRPNRADLVYKMIEVELYLVYDQLYTKARVIHIWYGHWIRAISLATSLAALCIFQTSKKDGYATPDIVITYILFVGAFSLEVTSTLRAIGSIWTYEIFIHKSPGVARAILFVRYCLMLAFPFILGRDGRWSDSIGQYNLISICNSNSTKTGRILKRVGLGTWWRRFHYTSHAKLSPAVKELVLKKVEEKASGMIQHGEPYTECRVTSGMEPWALKCMGFEECSFLDWTFQCDFEESILVWHIATTAFLECTADKGEGHKDAILRESISILSDYMVYLLTMHRNILHIPSAKVDLYDRACSGLFHLWHVSNLKLKHTTLQGATIRDCMRYMPGSTVNSYWATLVKSNRLLQIMLNMNLDPARKLQVFAGVWVEMLCYAARSAPGEFHAGQLSKGGEFLTHVLLLTGHIGIKKPGNIDDHKLSLTAAEISESEDHMRAYYLVEISELIPYEAEYV